HKEVDSLSYGSVGVILGLKHTRTGDTLTSVAWTPNVNSPSTLRSIVPPPAVISASVIPHSQSDVQPVQDALISLSRTDPSLRVSEDVQEGQTLVHGLGALHLEIVEGRLKDEWGVKAQFGKRRVSYREGLGGQDQRGVKAESRWEKDMGGKRVAADVSLTIRALRDGDIQTDSERLALESWGDNLVSVNDEGKPLVLPSPESTAYNHSLYPVTSPTTALLQGILSGLSSSPHTLLPLSHLHITVMSHTLDHGSPPSILTSAASDALRKALREAGPGQVMEPYIRVKVDVGDEGVGKVVKDLTEHSGEILDLGSGIVTNDDEVGPYSDEGIYIPSKSLTPASAALEVSSGAVSVKRSISAVAPLARMLDYSSRLRAVSGGQATFEMAVEGFRAVNEARRMEILREIGRA
ncbi:Ribosome-releasing factor 2, mitochondrial, partial [Tulasnella sp. 403]